jgi:hypothetical protein
MENGELRFTTKTVYKNACAGKNHTLWGGQRKRQKVSHEQTNNTTRIGVNNSVNENGTNVDDPIVSDDEEDLKDLNEIYHRHKNDANDAAWYRNITNEKHQQHEKNFDLFLHKSSQSTISWQKSHKLHDLQQPIHSVQGLLSNGLTYTPVFAKMTILMLLFSFVAYEVVCNINESQEAGLLNLVLPLLGERLRQLWPNLNAGNTNGSKSSF